MLLRIDDEAKIARCQRQFETCLRNTLSKRISHKFGHLGVSYEEEVITDGDLWYFGQLAGEPDPNRYWNAFGLLSAPKPANIVVEINFPLQGAFRRISGVFARDSEIHKIVILHRGGIGGGRRGMVSMPS